MATQRKTRAAASTSSTTDNVGKPIRIEVRSRGRPIKSLPEETYVTASDSGKDVYDRVAAKSRIDKNRLRITKASDGTLIPNSVQPSVDELGIYEGSSVFVKDLGPQIAWKTVFIVEYLGPLLLHPIIYGLRNVIYVDAGSPSLSQTLSFWMIVLHFVKREIETLFVHRFSSATMPAFNIFKNSAHYWILAGFNIAIFTYSPSDTCPTAHDPQQPWLLPLAAVLFLVGELGNLSAHLTLRGLRSEGTKERGIPSGGVFNIIPVTCPNYFFETMAWAGIWLANRSLATGLFVVVAVGQMAVWARKKESRYRKEFGSEYSSKRFAMLPGIV